MITIKTPRGFIQLPRVKANDTQAIEGNCMHGVSLFDFCRPCDFVSVQLEVERLFLRIMEAHYAKSRKASSN